MTDYDMEELLNQARSKEHRLAMLEFDRDQLRKDVDAVKCTLEGFKTALYSVLGGIIVNLVLMIISMAHPK